MTLFRVPIRIEPSFLFLTMMFGLSGGSRGIESVVSWVVAVFIAVLVHEMGHALMARAFGYAPWVSLHGMGGTTYFQNSVRKTTVWHEIAITLAGPGAGFVLGALVLLGWWLVPVDLPPGLRLLGSDLMWCTFGWGVLNLIPMLPLDGGHVARYLCMRFVPGSPRLPWIITVVVGTLSAATALYANMLWWAVLSGFSVFRAVQAVREMGPSPVVATKAAKRAPAGQSVAFRPREATAAAEESPGQGAGSDPDPVREARGAFIRDPNVVTGAALVGVFVAARRFSALAAVAAGPDGRVIDGGALLVAAKAAYDAGVVRGAIELGELAFARGAGAPAGELMARAFGRLGEREVAAQWVERTSMLPDADVAALREAAELAALRDDPRWELWGTRGGVN
ncbi:hypothetical protein LBMAG42_46160 [Deltaproteobacteria bacterium]|nr:hypothetical protein LBMAG42_46160 [Deltaproteobacteria bacterium]